MKNGIFKKFNNASLFAKISIIIWGLTLMITGVILGTAVFYYSRISRKTILSSARSMTENAVQTLNVNYTDIIQRFVAVCGTEDFTEKLHSFADPQSTNSVRKEAVQDVLSSLHHCNYMVHSAVVLTGDGKDYYCHYNTSLQPDLLPLISEEERKAADGITWLSERPSPFYSMDRVIPILFPLRLSEQNYVRIAFAPYTPDVYIILLLDSQMVSYSLTFPKEAGFTTEFLLLSPEGKPLTPCSPDLEEVLSREDTKDFIQSLQGIHEGESLFSAGRCYLLASPLERSGLFLLNFVQKESFLSAYGDTGTAILVLLALVILFLLIVAFILTRYVTRPLNTLTEVVKQIADNTYREKVVFSTSDEVGQLCGAINRMYDTIQDQIEQIKQEETMKFNTEIRLLTEQINPHFLYNTLECIQDEVARGESDTASGMIQCLAEYLRIGLSYGDSMITVANELNHVYSYIRIMNQRFQQSIRFMYQVEPGLEKEYVLKTILQPLAENSIKHGFSIDGSGIPIPSPTIEISVYRSGERMSMEITDNGAGFDLEKTKQILYHNGSDGNERHVGLYNIYYRMITRYGPDQVSFALSSIPYYRNSITMTFPIVQRKESNDQAGT